MKNLKPSCAVTYRDNSKSGHLFVFEGPDGVGKSTLVSELASYLRLAGEEVLPLSFPGREPGTIGRHVYDLHHSPKDFRITEMSPASLQLLHIAAHIDLIERAIVPALEEKRTVLLDRYWWSTWVYGLMSKVPREHLELMINVEQFAWKGMKPCAAFLLQRDTARVDSAILSAYHTLAAQEAAVHPIVKIDNGSSITSLVHNVAATIFSYKR